MCFSRGTTRTRKFRAAASHTSWTSTCPTPKQDGIHKVHPTQGHHREAVHALRMLGPEHGEPKALPALSDRIIVAMHLDVVSGSSPVHCPWYHSAEPPFPFHLLQIQAVTPRRLSKPSFASHPSQQPSSSITPLFLNTFLRDILLNRENFGKMDSVREKSNVCTSRDRHLPRTASSTIPNR